MAPQKRKKPHDAETALPRRATRQNPAPNNEEHLLRSGRVLTGATEKHLAIHADTIVARGSRGDALKRKAGRPPGKRSKTITTRHTVTGRVLKENIQPDSIEVHNEDRDDDDDDAGNTSAESLEHLPPPRPTVRTRPAVGSPSPQTRLIPPKSPLQKQQQQQQLLRQTHAATAVTTTPKRATAPSADKPPKPPPTPRSDRNIDKVVLGNICFKAWYPSYYGKEVLGDLPSNNGSNNAGGKDKDGGGKIGGRIGGGKRAPPPMLDRLYVCPCCFKYSRELVTWWEHVRCCERTFEMPGRKVYTHPKGSRIRTVRVPSTTAGIAEGGGRGRGRKKSDGGAGVTIVEEVVTDNGEWSVWEVDGEKDRLFCQNLSLFAKLFLDNKSVFFDVTGFNYFLLAYTPPPPPPPPIPFDAQRPPHPVPTDTIPNSQSSMATTTSNNVPQEQPPLQRRPQVVGFFSKEKLSWDNNNLACILVFPPWQRKGLGALLMGVSYEISRREGILGGPEKPISELGRKGYKRFWAGEIARWLLSLDLSGTDGSSDVGRGGDGENQSKQDGEVVITIEQCSKATWIVPEDCLAVLRDIGVVEDTGPETIEVATGSAERRGASVSEEEGPVDGKEAKTASPRVRLDREAVRRWVKANKIKLTPTCDPNGFIEGYAIKKGEDEEVHEG